MAVDAASCALIAFPRKSGGLGTALEEVDISADHHLDIYLPSDEHTHRLYGRFIPTPGSVHGEALLQLYDPANRIVAQSRAVQGGYLLQLPPGQYQVRAGIASVLGGFEKIHDLGLLSITDDRRWDIDLSGPITAVEEQTSPLPPIFTLHQNFPNPFNPSTTILYQLDTSAQVELVLFDILGQEVRRLVKATQPAGNYSVYWDGRSGNGQILASGIYFYRLKVRSGEGVAVAVKKLVLVR
ncbi:MAG: T9SS type A sorting domain-containing protein [Gemmatimonadetes bacterium]|nr:T9SS type A sorting domain-containing protein [Gemmatimonadota bacterium]